MRILSRYVFKEQIYPFLTGFFFFTFILILNKLFVLADLIINKNVDIIIVLRLFLLMLPSTISLTVPMSVLISAIMAMSRLSSDFEIVALRSNGVSSLNIIKPVIVSGAAIFVLMLVFNETLLVRSNKNYNKIFIDILKCSPAAVLEEGIFTDLGDKTIWIEKIDAKNGELKNIILFSKNNTGGRDIIKAEKGQWLQKSDGSKSLNLLSGRIYSNEFSAHRFTAVDFSNGNAEIMLSESQISYTEDKGKLNTGEMNTLDLYLKLKSQGKSYKDDRNTALYWIELFKKHAIPFSCFIFSAIGAPIGMISRKNTRGLGFGISVVIFFVYYIIFMTCQYFSIKGIISPFIGVWAANLILLGVSIILIYYKEKIGR
ncbi:MAG: LptF/LptG family permease [Spirochaetes bacterium]|jgi:LPS export ABC transporter permease LptF|nr:LptF/LptG family permease [Spirochaetota bacterium]